MSAAEPVEVDRRGHVLVLHLNRPDRRNAFDLDAMYALGSALAAAVDDDEVGAVLLAARGPAFSAGVDLKAYADAMTSAGGPAEMNAAAQAGARAPRPGLGVLIGQPYPKPVVCAVGGPAVGLGCEIVLASDIVVASQRATFGLPEVRHGLAPSGGGAARLVKRMPWSRAMWMLLSGEPLDAPTALHFGLVTRLVEGDEDPVAVALDMATLIAGQPPEAVQATKDLAVRSLALFDDEVRRLSDDVMRRMSTSPEAAARVKGFLAARSGPPREGT